MTSDARGVNPPAIVSLHARVIPPYLLSEARPHDANESAAIDGAILSRTKNVILIFETTGRFSYWGSNGQRG